MEGWLWLLFNRILKIRGNRKKNDKKIKQYENVDVVLNYCNNGIAQFQYEGQSRHCVQNFVMFRIL
jgi:hypothetical protein